MKKIFFILAAVLLVAIAVFAKPLSIHAKIILFITEQFPQIPIKPLGLLTSQPDHQTVVLDSINGKVVADLYLPRSRLQPKAAMIVAMGVKTAPKDRPLLLSFSETLSRLGYVVIWPRLEKLDQGESLPEETETFVEAFKYVSTLPQADEERISFAGFSVGSSTALVAAANPQIAERVHSLVFFGGLFDIFDYLHALSTKTMRVDGEQIPWEAAEDAIDHTGGLLELANLQLSDFYSVEDELQHKPEYQLLKRFSPKEHLENFQAKIFILHDKSDSYVPYTESVKLYEAIDKEQVAAYHISDLFEHVQPNRPLNLAELAKLYGFLYKVFYYLEEVI